MLKYVATKIAHNSTIPALAGSGELRPLQDLITAEKSVVLSLQRLSADFARSSEVLRTWGVGEGDDLRDTLGASANILTLFSSALSQYASHGHRMRDQLKTIRTREEALDDLKRRRRTVMSNADVAEKKLSKMSREHKNVKQQQETLNRLRNELRSLDGDILAQEASLSAFKRTQTKTMMGLKFGGLLECCEKGIIAGEYGKLIIAEIPEETTPPGVPRSIYQGQRRTEGLVAEANRCVSDVVLSTTAPMRTPNQEYFTQAQAGDASAWAQNDAQAPGSTNSSRFLSTPQGLGEGRFIEPSSPTIPFPMPAVPQETRDGPKRRSIDDFGTAAWDSPGATEGRFHTYPARIDPSADADIHGDHPLVLHSRHDAGTSFSASINEARSTIGNRGTDVRASEDLPAPPSYEAQELEGLHHHPGRDQCLESSSDYPQSSRSHSVYSQEPVQLADLAGVADHNMPYQSRDGNQQKQEEEDKARLERQKQESQRNDPRLSTADDDWRNCRAMLHRLKTETMKVVKESKQLKKEWGELRRQITPKIGQLTNDDQSIRQITMQLIQICKPSDAPHPLIIYHALLSSLAKDIISQAETEVMAAVWTAEPLSKVTVNLLENLDGFPPIFFTRLVQRVGGWAIPVIVPGADHDGRPWKDNEEAMKVMGYRKGATGEEMETTAEYCSRIAGIMRLYFHILKFRLIEGPLWVVFQTPRYWVWFARMVGGQHRALLENPAAAYLIHTALDVMGSYAMDIWGLQWIKMLALVYEGATEGVTNGVAHGQRLLIGGSSAEGQSARVRVKLEVERIMADMDPATIAAQRPTLLS